MFPEDVLNIKQKFNTYFSFMNISNSNFFEKTSAYYKNSFYRQNINFSKKKNIWKNSKKYSRFLFYYKKLIKILLNKLTYLAKKKKLKNKLFFSNNTYKIDFFLDSANFVIKKKNNLNSFFFKNKTIFKKKNHSFFDSKNFNFLIFKNNQFENYLRLFSTPLFFKNFIYSKFFSVNPSIIFHNFHNNFLFFSEKNYFYHKTNNILFSNNVFPLVSSFSFNFKKYLLRTLTAKVYSFSTIPYHY